MCPKEESIKIDCGLISSNLTTDVIEPVVNEQIIRWESFVAQTMILKPELIEQHKIESW